eukprot:1026473-Prorocentrum_minimum.AAC.1
MAEVRRESLLCYVDRHFPPLRARRPHPPFHRPRRWASVFRPTLQYQYVRLDPSVAFFPRQDPVSSCT